MKGQRQSGKMFILHAHFDRLNGKKANGKMIYVLN